MKRIKMLKDDRGQNDGEGDVRDYVKNQEYDVTPGLAAAFESTGSCEILFDKDEAELLAEDSEQATTRTKAERKSKLKNK